MRVFITACFAMFCSFIGHATLSIEGIYQGKNLYVQNPENEDGFGFCVSKVTVNGDVMPGGTGTSAFEIDFSLFNIAIGEPLFIVIEHSESCKPKILNPEVLLPRSTFVVTSISATAEGKLNFSTTGEKGKMPFMIEQYRWDKWVQIGEIQGKGTSGINSYEILIAPHSGENTLRVVQIDHTDEKRASKEVKFKSTIPAVQKSPVIVKTSIQFTSGGKAVQTKYEIFDAYGNVVKKGTGTSVDCENLLKGAYYINFDNKTEKFFRG